jgi:uncharacterized membrane protein YfcA
MAFYFVVALCSIFIGLSKGGMGAVLVVLTTPLLSTVMPVSEAVSIALPMLLIADAFALWAYWKTWDMHYVRLLLPLTVVGVALGTYFLATLDDDTLRRLLGVFTLFFVGYRLASGRIRNVEYTPRNWHGYLAGFASGFGSALANTGAPPFTAYMLLQNISPAAFVGTTTLYFAIVNALKLPGLLVAHLLDFRDLIDVAWALPLIPLGVWLGRYIVQRLNKTAFERFMLVVLGFAGLILLLPL